jgi:PDZ domain
MRRLSLRWAGLFACLVMGATTSQLMAASQQATDSKETHKEHAKSDDARGKESRPFLGVLVSKVPPVIAWQLSDQSDAAKGVLVSEVADDSPAQKAGIKEFDILTAIGNQKIHSPEELTRLVRADKPGARVNVEVIRHGKQQSLDVTLGNASRHAENSERGAGILHQTRKPVRPSEEGASRTRKEEWEQFDSLELRKTGKDQFKAAISYLDKSGKIERREFSGTPEEIRRHIRDQKDLPRDERTQLLRSLNLSE